MNILTAVDEAYLEPLSVMLYSLARHNHTLMKVYVLHFHISKESQCKFMRSIEKWRKQIEFHFIKVEVEYFNRIAQSERYKLEANLRLALLEVLPDDMERIIWLDADIIVTGNIQKFYNYPDHGQYAVVCEDMCTSSEKHDLLTKIGMKYSDRYFNSGVMLFYLKSLRKHFNNNSFLLWAKNNPDKLKFPDQNVLNVCFQGNVTWAKAEMYNLQLLRINDEMHKKIRKAKIIHYNTQQKPWNDFYEGKGELVYWSYAISVLGIKRFIDHFFKKNVGKGDLT